MASIFLLFPQFIFLFFDGMGSKVTQLPVAMAVLFFVGMSLSVVFDFPDEFLFDDVHFGDQKLRK
jgi:hypothetical protein